MNYKIITQNSLNNRTAIESNMRNIKLRGLYPFIFLILFFISINTALGHIFFTSAVIDTISAALLLIFVILVLLFQPIFARGQRGFDEYENLKDLTVVSEGFRSIVSRNDGA